jgi:hypothetical protein
MVLEKDVGTLSDQLHPLDTGRPAKGCNVTSPLRHKEIDCQWNKTIKYVVNPLQSELKYKLVNMAAQSSAS